MTFNIVPFALHLSSSSFFLLITMRGCVKCSWVPNLRCLYSTLSVWEVPCTNLITIFRTTCKRSPSALSLASCSQVLDSTGCHQEEKLALLVFHHVTECDSTLKSKWMLPLNYYCIVWIIIFSMSYASESHLLRGNIPLWVCFEREKIPIDLCICLVMLCMSQGQSVLPPRGQRSDSWHLKGVIMTLPISAVTGSRSSEDWWGREQLVCSLWDCSWKQVWLVSGIGEKQRKEIRDTAVKQKKPQHGEMIMHWEAKARHNATK